MAGGGKDQSWAGDRCAGQAAVMTATGSLPSTKPDAHSHSTAAKSGSLATQQPSAGGDAGSLLLVCLGTVLAASGFDRAFSLSSLIVPLGCAATVPVLVAAVGPFTRRRIPLAISALASAVLWLLIAPSDVLGNDWNALLNVTLPAHATSQLLSVPFTLTWIAAAISAELAVRSGRPVAPALPFLCLFVVCLAGTVPGRGSVALAAAGLAADLLLLAAVRSTAVGFQAARLRSVQAGLVAIGLAAIAAVIAPVLPALGG